jgi:C4-dicarboxylate-specific signal transduction histidine kinase
MNIGPYTPLKLTRRCPLSLRSNLDNSLQNRHQHGCTGKSARPARTLFRTELAAALPLVPGDRVQLQQLMNLMINGIDAMKAVDGARQLAVKPQTAGVHQRFESGSAPRAAGGGPDIRGGLFDKASGADMGLSISGSIIESHGGQFWAAVNLPLGASFCFILRAQVEAHQ